MTELLRPFNESVNHRRKLCEGAGGKSSILGPVEDGALATTAGFAVADPFMRGVDMAETTDGLAGVGDGLAETAGGAVGLPLGPTTVQALP